jgi:putative transposase
VGWSIDNTMRTALVVDALGMAITRRAPERHSAILHSDHGSQFTSWAFGQRLLDAGLVGSMGSIGDCYDNSMMESFWGTLQLELLDSRVWYNPSRRHSSIGMLSPVDYEAAHTETEQDH